MSKEKQDKKLETVDESQKELVKKFEDKKNEIKKQRKLENPDERLTGYELQAMISTITGFRGQDGQMRTGVGNVKADSLFNTKLVKNLIEAQDNLEIVQALVPKLDEEDQKKFKEFQEKRLKIAKRNAGIPKTEEVEEVRYSMIETAGNTEIYENELEELKEEYRPVLDRKKNIEDKWREIMQLPLAKPDFDMIKRREIPDNLTAGEIGPLWPMICENCGGKK